MNQLELARRALRMAERELSEIVGQRKIVEEQLVLSQSRLAELGIAEDKLPDYIVALEAEVATIEQDAAKAESKFAQTAPALVA